MKDLVQRRVAKGVNSKWCQKILDDHAKIGGSHDAFNVRTLGGLRAPVVGRSDADRRGYSVPRFTSLLVNVVEDYSEIDDGKQEYRNTYIRAYSLNNGVLIAEQL